MSGLRLAAARPANAVPLPAAASVPAKPGHVVAKLRMEKKGRGGKMVTVVDGLPNNAAFLKDVQPGAQARLPGTGGAAGDSFVEVQGDLRDRVRELLRMKG